MEEEQQSIKGRMLLLLFTLTTFCLPLSIKAHMTVKFQVAFGILAACCLIIGYSLLFGVYGQCDEQIFMTTIKPDKVEHCNETLLPYTGNFYLSQNLSWSKTAMEEYFGDFWPWQIIFENYQANSSKFVEDMTHLIQHATTTNADQHWNHYDTVRDIIFDEFTVNGTHGTAKIIPNIDLQLFFSSILRFRLFSYLKNDQFILRLRQDVHNLESYKNYTDSAKGSQQQWFQQYNNSYEMVRLTTSDVDFNFSGSTLEFKISSSKLPEFNNLFLDVVPNFINLEDSVKFLNQSNYDLQIKFSFDLMDLVILNYCNSIGQYMCYKIWGIHYVSNIFLQADILQINSFQTMLAGHFPSVLQQKYMQKHEIKYNCMAYDHLTRLFFWKIDSQFSGISWKIIPNIIWTSKSFRLDFDIFLDDVTTIERNKQHIFNNITNKRPVYFITVSYNALRYYDPFHFLYSPSPKPSNHWRFIQNYYTNDTAPLFPLTSDILSCKILNCPTVFERMANTHAMGEFLFLGTLLIIIILFICFLLPKFFSKVASRKQQVQQQIYQAIVTAVEQLSEV